MSSSSEQQDPLPEAARRARGAAQLLLVFFAACTACALLARYPYTDDDVTHFLIARHAPQHFWAFLDLWGRPAYTILHCLPAQLGYLACRFLSVLLSLLAAWLTYRVAVRARLRLPELAIPLLLLQPRFFQLSFATLTETVYAPLLAAALLCYQADRPKTSALLFSAGCLARPEGFLLLPAVGVACLWRLARAEPGARRRWLLSLLLLGSVPLAWNFIGAATTGFDTLLWLVATNPFIERTAAFYGHGSWFAFVLKLPVIAGATLIPFLLLGIWGAIRKKRFFVAGLVLYFFALQTVLWKFGLFGSAGYPRYFVAIGPGLALLHLEGFQLLAGLPARDKLVLPRLRLLTSLSLVALGAAFLLLVVNPLIRSHDYEAIERLADQCASKQREGPEHRDWMGNHPYLYYLMERCPFGEQSMHLTRKRIEQAPKGTLIALAVPMAQPPEQQVALYHFFPEEVWEEARRRIEQNEPYHDLLLAPRRGFRVLADESVYPVPEPPRWNLPYYAYLFVKTDSP